jgi:protein FRA10AC1
MPALPETDLDALRHAYRFVRDDEGEGEEEGEGEGEGDEGNRTRLALASQYESSLFREYALADLSRYETKQIGLRWRTKPECQSGKGEATCGALDCSAADSLSTFELPFVYREGGREDKTTTLVKLRVCPTCATKVELISKKGEKKKKKKKKRDEGERADNAKRKREGAGCML